MAEENIYEAQEVQEQTEETQQKEADSVYSQALQIATTSGNLYLKALDAGDVKTAKEFFEQWKLACEKLAAFDENVHAVYKTDQELAAKLEMNKLDNETKLQIAEREEELKRELAEKEMIMQRAQFIADCITKGININMEAATRGIFMSMDCVRMAWESNGYAIDNSKMGKAMLSHGNKLINTIK